MSVAHVHLDLLFSALPHTVSNPHHPTARNQPSTVSQHPPIVMRPTREVQSITVPARPCTPPPRTSLTCDALGALGMVVEATTPPPPSRPCPSPKSKTMRRSVPYPHQVGGHGQLRQVTPGHVLKPGYEKELNFYNYIHSAWLPCDLHWLRHVTPAFYGERDMSCSESSSDDEDVRTTNAAATALAATGCGSSRSRSSVRLGAGVSNGAEETDEDPISFEGQSPEYMSPWALSMGRRNKTKVKKKSKTIPGLSICLEDLNYPFRLPCILDVKVGTRHYDDDATPEKRRHHIAKSEATTSAKYGVRFTGMQSYKLGRSDFHDKYHGRKLKGHDLGPELEWFFFDGDRVRVECVIIIIEKLRRIRNRMAEQRHFKFYSSSVLLIYEGAHTDEAPVRADIRMIDFAHTQWNEHQGDQGYLMGIDTLLRLLSEIVEDSNHKHHFEPHIHKDIIPIDPEPTSV